VLRESLRRLFAGAKGFLSAATGVSLPGVAFLLAGLASVASVRGQAPGGQKPVYVLPPVSVEFVRLDVVVTDKGGHPLTGLAREDFAVFEDGQLQTLAQFEAYSRRLPGMPPAPSTPAVAVAAAAEEPARPRPPRYLVLAVDDFHIEFGNLIRAQKALTRFVEEDVGPEDRVALVTMSGAVSQELTTDRALLRQAISRITPRARGGWMGVPYISEYQAELIERGDQDALAVAVDEILRERPMDPNPEAEARHKARAIFEESVYSARATLGTLENLIRNMSRLPGRKVLFLVSDGFLVGLAASGGLGYDIRSITDAGTRAGVVVYSLETRGLAARMHSGGLMAASTRQVGMTDAMMYSRVFSMERQSEEATRDAMHALAADTGGFLVQNANDLHAGLKRMLDDTETYYVLAYEPTNTKRDGAFRRIEVRLPGHRGVRVRARAGYFAPGDRRASSPSRTSKKPKDRPSESGEAPLPAIPVHLSADFVSVDRGVSEVVVSGLAEATRLPFVRQGDRYKTAIEMVAAVHDQAGVVVTTLEPQRLALDMTEAQRERLSREGIPYQETAALPPGRYEVRLTVRAAGAGAVGIASQWVEIPDLTAGRLTLSSLFLLKAGEEPGSESSLVLSQARRHFRRDQALYMQLYAYNPKRDAAGAVSLAWQASILRGGVAAETGVLEPMMVGEAQGPPVPHTSRMELGSLEPGEYELEVTVIDQNAGEKATRRVGFTIDEP
jgi:VWFA-related protein